MTPNSSLLMHIMTPPLPCKQRSRRRPCSPQIPCRCKQTHRANGCRHHRRSGPCRPLRGERCGSTPKCRIARYKKHALLRPRPTYKLQTNWAPDIKCVPKLCKVSFGGFPLPGPWELVGRFVAEFLYARRERQQPGRRGPPLAARWVLPRRRPLAPGARRAQERVRFAPPPPLPPPPPPQVSGQGGIPAYSLA